MKFFLTLLSFLYISSATAQLNRRLFNENWEFQLRPTEPVSVVSLPHTPRLEPLVMQTQFTGQVIYRKRFHYKLDPGKRLLIHFEGAMHTAKVLLNGLELGTHVGGYLPFEFDLTSALKDSANLLEVYLDNREDVRIPPGKPLPRRYLSQRLARRSKWCSDSRPLFLYRKCEHGECCDNSKGSPHFSIEIPTRLGDTSGCGSCETRKHFFYLK